MFSQIYEQMLPAALIVLSTSAPTFEGATSSITDGKLSLTVNNKKLYD